MNKTIPLSYSFMFKSILLFHNSGRVRYDFNSLINSIYEWIYYFDTWYKENFRINEGLNLHLIYHRNFYINDCFNDELEKIYNLVKKILSIGIEPILELDVDKFLNKISNVNQFIDDFSGVSLVFRIHTKTKYKPNEKYKIKEVINHAFSSNNRINFSGNYLSWLKTGVFQNDKINSRPFSIITFDQDKHPTNSEQFNFRNNMKIVINGNGEIYPCTNLIGQKRFLIGNVFSDRRSGSIWTPKALNVINELFQSRILNQEPKPNA